MIADLFAVADLRGVDGCRFVDAADGSGYLYKCRDLGFHVVGQAAAVCARIGADFLFIQALQIIECLLRRISEKPVGVALKGGQIIRQRRFFAFFLSLDFDNAGQLPPAGCCRAVGFGFILEFFRRGGKGAAVEIDCIERFRLKSVDFGFALNDQRQRRGHYAAHIQRPVVEYGKQPCGVDAHKPVGFRPADSGLMQTVIIAAGFQIGKARADSLIFHRGNPQAFHCFCAAGKIVDISEDQLSFAPGVAGVDHFGDILPAHQAGEKFKLRFLIFGDNLLPFRRDNRQVVIAPLSVFLIVLFRLRQFRQVSKTPADKIAVSFEIAVPARFRADHSGYGLCDRGLFSDYKFCIHFSPFSCVCSYHRIFRSFPDQGNSRNFGVPAVLQNHGRIEGPASSFFQKGCL